MITYKKFIREIISILFLISVLATFLLTQSCKNDNKQAQSDIVKVEKENVIEIITEHMDFQMPDTITSGWNTFRYKNLSTQTHFFLIDKYPEAKTPKDAKNFVAPVFDSAMKLITKGKIEEGFAEFSNLPKWFKEVVFVGGSGLLSPGKVGETMIKLKSGKYIVECYVKMSNGIFHTSMGMTKDLVVSEIDSGNKELISDIEINISSTDGIVLNNSIRPGKYTFSVYYKDQTVHENFVGHNINLANLNDNADLKKLESWMNWPDPKGLMGPPPPSFIFLGGVNDMPIESHGYFIAWLEPGKYALVGSTRNNEKKYAYNIYSF